MTDQYALPFRRSGGPEDQKGPKMDPMQEKMADRLDDQGNSQQLISASTNKVRSRVLFLMPTPNLTVLHM